MTGRPSRIALGCGVHYCGHDWLVAELRASQVTLSNAGGEVCAALVPHLISADDFELPSVTPTLVADRLGRMLRHGSQLLEQRPSSAAVGRFGIGGDNVLQGWTGVAI